MLGCVSTEGSNPPPPPDIGGNAAHSMRFVLLLTAFDLPSESKVIKGYLTTFLNLSIISLDNQARICYNKTAANGMTRSEVAIPELASQAATSS